MSDDLYADALDLGAAVARKSGNIARMVLELMAQDALVENQRNGNGWSVVSGGVSREPSSATGFVWADKGLAWAYWMGLGQPEDAVLMCLSDPRAELATPRHLHVVS